METPNTWNRELVAKRPTVPKQILKSQKPPQQVVTRALPTSQRIQSGRPHPSLIRRAVTYLVVSARRDGAIGLDENRRRDAVTCQYPNSRSKAEGGFLHGIKQDAVEVLVFRTDIFCE
jgi:hypothetical protein